MNLKIILHVSNVMNCELRFEKQQKEEDENNLNEKWFRVQREIEKSENFLLVMSEGSRNLSVKEITWKKISEHVRWLRVCV